MESLPTNEAEYDLHPAAISLIQKQIRQTIVDDPCDTELNLAEQAESPVLFTLETFEELNLKPELIRGTNFAGYERLTNVQSLVLSLLLNKGNKSNVLVQSQSGTGKSTAFELAMLQHVVVARSFPQALCIVPTAELAKQISNQVQLLARFIPDVRILTATKDAVVPKNELLRDHIVIGTPGTVLEWIRTDNILDPSCLRVFILDEADIMLSMQGFIEQSLLIVKLLSPGCKIGLFSATYQPPIVVVARETIPNLCEFTLRPKQEFLGNVNQFYSVCNDRDSRFSVVRHIYSTIAVGKSIIFCKTRMSAHWIGANLNKCGAAEVLVLTGDLDISERIQILLQFRDGSARFLIATNLVSRGIDIEGVNLVINYDLPMSVRNPNEVDFDTYLHRVGRTGRIGLTGMAINLISKEEIDQIKRIEEKFAVRVENLPIEEPNITLY